MPENKFNYFAVVTTTVVKSKNKKEAEKVSFGFSKSEGEILFKSTDIERISSLEAHKQADQLSE